MSNGESESLAMAEKVKQVLREYERGMGLPALSPSNEVTALLEMGSADLGKLTPGELAEAGFVLHKHSLYLQRQQNHEQAIHDWAEESLKKTIAPLLPSQKAYAFEERRLGAIEQSLPAQDLDKLRVQAKLRLNILNDLSRKIEGMSKILFNLAGRR